MGQILDFLKEVSDVWPIVVFIGATIYGYVRLRFKVEDLEEKLKTHKVNSIEVKEDIESDIKGVSQKTNTFIKEVNEELKQVRKENSDNHLKVSNDLHELKGMILVLSSEKK